MKHIYPISELAHSFIGMIFFLSAYIRPKSDLIAKRTGIRAVFSKSYLANGEEHLKDVSEALFLLERFDRESTELIKKI